MLSAFCLLLSDHPATFWIVNPTTLEELRGFDAAKLLAKWSQSFVKVL